MWAYLFSKARLEGRSDDDEIIAAERGYSLPGTNAQPDGVPPLFIHLGKKRVRILVKADLTDEQASIVANNDQLLTGTTKLIWWEPIMAGDFQQTLRENDREEIKVCKIDLGNVGDKEAAVLAEMVKVMPDCEDKDKFLAILNGRKETKPEPKPDYLALAIQEEQKTLESFLEQVATVEGDDKAVIESMIAKAKEMPDGIAKESVLEVLDERLRAATKEQPAAQETQH